MNFSKEEFEKRIKETKNAMIKNGIDILICTDPSNMYYLSGYDGWSFYVPQLIILNIDYTEPVWIGRKQDANGAKILSLIHISEPTRPY